VDTFQTTFANYQLLEELGRGTSGIVYKARHVPSGYLTAVKVLEQTSDEDQILLFRREIRLLACLLQPNIAVAYDVDLHEGRHFFVREFVEGHTLEQSAKSGLLTLQKALSILSDIARAVEEVHRHGWAHNNLHPSNILVALDGTAKLIGFGRHRILAGSELDNPGARSVPATVDVKALQDILKWLCSSLGPATPPELTAFYSGETLTSAAAFAEALTKVNLNPPPHGTGILRRLGSWFSGK
jgi:serine/threonine protein kinase